MATENAPRHFLSRDFSYIALLLEGILGELRYMRGLDPADASFSSREEAAFALPMEELLRVHLDIFGPNSLPLTASASAPPAKEESAHENSQPAA